MAQAAACSPRPSYERHEPNKSLLFQTIQNNLKSFLSHCDAEGHPVPHFIKKEFEAYLRCGVLAYGFARVYCQECQYDRLVPFSCKKCGFCSSCMARRMSETAVRLVDSVIPEIPTRQWVLSVPPPLRYLIAYDNQALNELIKIFIATIFSYLRRKANKPGCQLYPGAVTFIQRFGSALNLNLHLHSQISDGVYEKRPGGLLKFHRVAAPSLAETKQITQKIANRVHCYLQKRMHDLELDGLDAKEPFLAKCYAASIRYLSALGANAGKQLLRIISDSPSKDDDRFERTVAGFNLHTSVAIEGHDRKALERILRYMGRPPLSQDRLKQAPDGQRLILTLKTPWRDGTSKIILSSFELLERLVAIIPPPRKNQIRYHGCFGHNAKIRKLISPQEKDRHIAVGHSSKRIARPAFAQLMARIFEIDVLVCPRCQSKLQIISFITEPEPIRDILRALKMSTAPPDIPKSVYSIEYEQQADLFIDV